MISPEQGVGIVFEYNGNKCITLPRTRKYDLYVQVNVHTFKGSVVFAEHFYASLNVSNLSCKIIGDKSDRMFISNMQPEESKFKRIDIFAPAMGNIYGESFGVRELEIRKGCPTIRFESIKDCIEAIESTFKEEFSGEPWVLSGSNYEPWEEAKLQLIKLYREGDQDCQTPSRV
jgi:hypothetical protein